MYDMCNRNAILPVNSFLSQAMQLFFVLRVHLFVWSVLFRRGREVLHARSLRHTRHEHGCGRGGTPVFTTEYRALAVVALYLTRNRTY